MDCMNHVPVCPEEHIFPVFVGIVRVKPKPVIRGFERELTDTSKQSIQGFRK